METANFDRGDTVTLAMDVIQNPGRVLKATPPLLKERRGNRVRFFPQPTRLEPASVDFAVRFIASKIASKKQCKSSCE